MLVLTRAPVPGGDEIIIGDNIVVKVTKIENNVVYLGIDTCGYSGDEIPIAKDVKLKVVKVRDTVAYIGIDAPREIPIVRPDAKCQKPKPESA